MRVSAQAFWAPKAGNQESEYEDAFWPRCPIVSKKDSSFRFAVADGATETSFSGAWAKQLVRAFSRGELEGPGFPERLHLLRKRWLKVVSRPPMAWYAEEKIRSGAFAAIVGLVLKDTPEPKGQGTWTALAVGDSCVVQLREEELLRCFPIQRSDQFNNSPRLFASTNIQGEADAPALPATCGTCNEGDTFYLMTDATACWFLKEVESGHVPARELRNLSDGKSKHFQSWLKTLRERRVVRNDDVTIVRVEIEKF
jgi:hypothetical protein